MNISYKLEANRQKNNFFSFLKENDIFYQLELENSEKIFFPKMNEIIEKFFLENKKEKSNRNYQKSDFFDKNTAVFNFSSILNKLKDDKYYLLLSPVIKKDFKGEIKYTSDFPFIVLNEILIHNIWNKLCSDLNKISSIYFLAIECEFNSGAKFDCYTGSDENKENPDQIVYEISSWNRAN